MESCSDARTATAVTFRRQGARIFINGMWFDAETVRLAYGSSTFAKVLHEMLVTDFLAGDDDSEAGKLVLAECSARAVSHSASPSCAGRAVVDTFMQPAVANAAGCGTPPLRQDRLSSDGGDGSCGGSPADAWRDRPAVPSGELRIDIECRWHVAEDIRAVIGDERLAAFLLRAPAQALCANDGEVRAAWLLWGGSQIVPVGGATASRRAASPPFCSMQATRLSPRQSVARCSCATVCSRCHPRAMGGITVPPGAIILPRAVGDGLVPCTGGSETQISAAAALYARELRLWLLWTADGTASFGDSTAAFGHWCLARRSLGTWARRRRCRRDCASRSRASAVLTAWAVRRSVRLRPALAACATRLRGGGGRQMTGGGRKMTASTIRTVNAHMPTMRGPWLPHRRAHGRARLQLGPPSPLPPSSPLPSRSLSSPSLAAPLPSSPLPTSATPSSASAPSCHPPPPPSKPTTPHSTPPTHAPYGPAHPRLQPLDRLASVTRQLFPASPPRSDPSPEVAVAPLSSSRPLSLPPSLPSCAPPLVPPAEGGAQEMPSRVLGLELTGLRVQLDELISRPELDGECVEIVGPAADGRFPVRVVETTQRIRVRPRNLFYYGVRLSHEIPSEVQHYSYDLQNELVIAGRTAAELHRFALGPEGHLGLAGFFDYPPPATTAAPSPEGRSPMRRLTIEDDDGSPSAASPSAAPAPTAAPPRPVEPAPGWRPPPPPPPAWMPTALDLFVYASRAAMVQAMRRLGTAATHVFGSEVLEGRVRQGWRRLSISARRYFEEAAMAFVDGCDDALLLDAEERAADFWLGRKRVLMDVHVLKRVLAQPLGAETAGDALAPPAAAPVTAMPPPAAAALSSRSIRRLRVFATAEGRWLADTSELLPDWVQNQLP